MNAIIVAAGMGSRLKEFTNNRPKCMCEVSGESIFKRQTDTLLNNGVSAISVVTGYKKEWFTDKRFKYFVNTDYENNNILHSLFYAEDAMDSDFIFSYCDILYDGEIVEQMVGSSSDIAVAVDPDWIGYYEGRHEHPIEEAELVFSEDGKTVSRISKDADHSNSIGEFLGLAYFSKKGAEIMRDVFHELKEYYLNNPKEPFHKAESFQKAYMTDMYQELINRGITVDIIKINGNWAEIDTPRDLAVAGTMWK